MSTERTDLARMMMRCKDCAHWDRTGPQVARGTAGMPRQALCRVGVLRTTTGMRWAAPTMRWAWETACDKFEADHAADAQKEET